MICGGNTLEACPFHSTLLLQAKQAAKLMSRMQKKKEKKAVPPV